MSIDNQNITVATEKSSIQLKKDDYVAEAFLLKSVFLIAIISAFLYVFFRKYTKKMYLLSPTKELKVDVIKIIDSSKISMRTRIFLLEIDGRKAAIIETPNKTEISWLPEEVQNNDQSIK